MITNASNTQYNIPIHFDSVSGGGGGGAIIIVQYAAHRMMIFNCAKSGEFQKSLF
jgi:hypothetical protein